MDNQEKSEQIFRDYLSRRESGEVVDPEEYLRKYPEMAKDLKKLFDDFKLKQTNEVDLAKTQTSTKPLIIGDFKINREIGSGGMGTVYEAEQISLKRKVALKLIKDDYAKDPVAVKRFRREAEAAGRLSHPGIVQVHAFGDADGKHFMVQEYIHGDVTLADRLETARKMSDLPNSYFLEAADLFSKIADALQHAHDHGVIHRDIKPRNILLSEVGYPKVTDFGIAQIEGKLGLTRKGDQIGTVYYWSPEQATAKTMGDIDHRTDIFSLGVSLYEALTLVLPFQGDSRHKITRSILLDEPKKPRKIQPRIPRDLSVVCLKALEKKCEHRYQTMADLSGDLRRFQNDEPIIAKPPGPYTRTMRYSRKHPYFSATCVVIMLVIMFCIIFHEDVINWLRNVLAFLGIGKAFTDAIPRGFSKFLKGAFKFFRKFDVVIVPSAVALCVLIGTWIRRIKRRSLLRASDGISDTSGFFVKKQ